MDKVLLDTTYLLPVFGIRVKLRRFEELFPRFLEEYSVLYNPISIVEAKWVILKLSRRKREKRLRHLEAYRKGLKALLSDERLQQTSLTNPTVEQIADKLLLNVGVKDYFDRVIYATAAHHNAVLLTEDRELAGIEHPEIPKPAAVMTWNDVVLRL